jgi:drug/metabolite transporter (DMT)-like permease
MFFRAPLSSSGVLQISLASILWGSAYFFRKLILSNVSPLLLSFLTLAFATITLVLIFRPRASHLFAIFLRRPWAFFGLSFGNAIAQVSFLDALDHGDLSSVILLERIQPAIGVLLAAIFLREYIPRHRIAFVLLAFVCSALLIVKSLLTPIKNRLKTPVYVLT